MELAEVVDGDGVRLRPYREADAPRVVAGAGDPQTQRFMPAMPRPYDEGIALAWVRDGAVAERATGRHSWAIADPDTDELLGGFGLRVSNDGRAQAEVGYWICPDARRRGVATAATRAAVAHGFAAGLGRIELQALWANIGSQRVAAATGFRREGERRGVLRGVDGRRHDTVVWARLATDDGRPVPRLLPDPPAAGLTDGVVALRPLGPADADALHALRSLPDVVVTSVPPVPPPLADTVERCERAPAHWLAGTRADVLVLDAATGAVAGDLGLYYRAPQIGEAMIGYSLLPAWRGRGYATRAAALLARWAFDIGIARLVAGAGPDNVGSQRTLERAGFRREGYAVGQLPGPGGRRTDDVLFALLPEWLRPAP
ncbi:hypothetical protein GCM10010123_39650 [Pilimelia anulata]|uniref:N-acetyltransferase domain-containing protein n=1 Tax=Pilimelia anulata TaxID=53371 RepID=A0A8J3BEZ2_9ACTN|nr:GNAT family N-acetyltransferase [Pilimelia anulata]GGK05769.1 hypothetical protein GCM10010123_39650 [Pilimelia anulata]